MRAHGCDVVEEDRFAVEHADHELRHVVAVAEECAGLHRRFNVARDQRAGVCDDIARRQGRSQVVEGHTETGDALRVELDVDDVFGATDRVDVARAGNALDFRLERVCDFQ